MVQPKLVGKDPLSFKMGNLQSNPDFVRTELEGLLEGFGTVRGGVKSLPPISPE